jgi:hypothetical protein
MAEIEALLPPPVNKPEETPKNKGTSELNESPGPANTPDSPRSESDADVTLRRR